MSEPKLVSPLLDGCILGQAISCHDGVRCCPAIREENGEKLIVKIISIPSSQVQLDALLLTGAYSNREDALGYFMELAQDILKEKDILSNLSRLEGFVPHLDAQIVPMEDGVGFEVYLLSPYKKTAEKLLDSKELTHLSVVNLGLDMCAALAAARRAGQLYVDLKPSNIFQLEGLGFRIGDLGFVPLSSLQFATLPEKYRSIYTPAEVLDTMAVLNDTVDIYALGLVLYQAYNGGSLPEKMEGLEPPMYADYEMAEIILKACDPVPEKRWKTPAEMGQALVQYMQRNSVNDDPIIPPPPPAEEPEEEIQEAVEEFLPEQEPQPEELAFLNELVNDETAPNEENTSDLEDTPLSEETSQMLAQADELIEHELPEPVVAPEPVEIPIPAPILPEAEEPRQEEAPEVTIAEELPQEEAPQEEAAPVIAEETEEAPPAPAKKKKKGAGLAIALLLLLALLTSAAFGGLYYYENYYLQTVDNLLVSGTVDTMTVEVVSQIEDQLLTVVCTDSYGNTYRSPVTGGLAVFRDLQPQTRYNIRLEISGYHKLRTDVTASFTTATQTNILSFNAGIGATDGSVLLSFTVGGRDTENWTVTYGAPGVPAKTLDFTGHSVGINDLVIGAEYTFTLSSKDTPYIIGSNQVTFQASKIILAQDLLITACGGGSLTTTWNAPEGTTGITWMVRCYDENGYNQTITTTDTSYTFTGLDHSSQCTVEIFAAGMNQSVSTSIVADPITISGFHFDATEQDVLLVSWDFIGSAPAGGWILQYITDGVTREELVVDTNSAALLGLPNCNYTITIRPAEDRIVFGSTSTEYKTPEAEGFKGYRLTYEDLEFKMCIKPDRKNWSNKHVDKEDYTTQFKPGQAAGFVVRVHANYGVSMDNIEVKFILRDGDGNLLRIDTQNIQWSYIWYGLYGDFDVPAMPEEAGSYTLSIYFNGKFVAFQPFEILQ